MNKILRTNTVIASSVAVITFMVYLPSLQNEFVNWDDAAYVYENPFIRALDTGLLKSAFTGFHAGNWHPLTWLSHAFDYAIWGLNPLGHHLTNNILHALNTLMVVLLVMRLMEVIRKTEGKSGLSRSSLNDRTTRITGAATGLLFGLHPLHVESVAWVAERKDLLCALFFLLTIMTYTRYVSEISASSSVNPASRFFNNKYLITIGYFILSLLSKPMAVTTPFVLLILDWYFFRRIQSLKTLSAAFIEKIPLLALTLIASILTILAQTAEGGVASIEDIPLTLRLIVAAKSLVAYLVKMMLPLNLVPLYPYPKDISFFSLEYFIPIVIVLAVTATSIAIMKKQKLWISVWGYYVITLIPVLGIIQVGSQAMADRYTYIPSLGPFMVIGFMAAKFYEKASALNRWGVMLRIAGLFVALTMLVSLSYATIEQIGIWKNNILLWNYIIAKEPSRVPIAIAHNNLGLAYSAEGQFDMAIEQFEIVLRLKPDQVETHNNLGIAYASKGLFDMAIEQFKTALRLKPDHLTAYNNLGNVYASKGLVDMAIEQYRVALSLEPDYAEAHYNLGNAYVSKGLFDMAIEQYNIALSLNPDYAEARHNLGIARASKKAH